MTVHTNKTEKQAAMNGKIADIVFFRMNSMETVRFLYITEFSMWLFLLLF